MPQKRLRLIVGLGNPGSEYRETRHNAGFMVLDELGRSFSIAADKKKFDAVILGWSGSIDPDAYNVWHSSKTGPKEYNFISYKNPEVDELLEKGRHTFDQEERKKYYFRFQEILAEEQPYTFS